MIYMNKCAIFEDVHDVATDHHVAQHILGLHRRRESETTTASQLSQLELQRYIRLRNAGGCIQ